MLRRGWLPVLLIAVFSGSVVCADDESGQLAFPDVEPNYVDDSLIVRESQSFSGGGLDGRLGFIGLPAFGRDHSIVPIELFPYIQSDNRILFGDLRGFIDTQGNVGGNAGIGFRFIDPSDTALFGINAFYDADDTTGEIFQQVSVGWEARLEMAGLFGNVYFPVGEREKIISRTLKNPRFEDHNILFDLQNRIGNSMQGLDVNLQAYLPGKFFQEHQVQAMAGWYHFEGNANTPDINGVRVGLQSYIIPEIGSQITLTNDATFGTNVNVGIFWRFGTRDLPDTSLRGQLRRYVERNYNVIVSQRTEVQNGLTAINPETGSAYIVQHVGSNTGTGTGTTSDPFTTIGDAQGAGADVIFVHGGSVLNENVVLENGQYLLGEGTAFQLRDARYGLFNVPGATGNTNRPVLSGVTGDAVVMGDFSTISGINIINPTGRGIVADEAEGFVIENVRIEDAGGDAVYLRKTVDGSVSNVTVSGGGGHGFTILDVDDVLNLQNIYVEDVAGDGIHINGGLGTIAFTDELVIQNVGGAGFSVEFMEQLTEVDDKGTTTTTDDVTTVTPSVVSVEQLVIRGAPGSIGLYSDQNEGIIGIGQVDIETENAAAMVVNDTTLLMIGNGYLSSTNGAVADIDSSKIDVRLTQINVDGGLFGARFVDTEGAFLVYGDGSNLGSGGAIKDTDVAVIMEEAGTVGLQTVDFENNGKLAEIVDSDLFTMVGSRVSGTTDMFIDATNLTRLQVYQSEFTNNSLASNVGIRFQVDEEGSYTAAVSNNTSTDTVGTFFQANTLAGAEGSSLALAFQYNQIELDSVGGVAAGMDWTGASLVYITNNTIVGNHGSQKAFQLITGDETDIGQINVNQNLITLSGSNSVGIDLNFGNPVNAIIDANQINLNGLNGIGMRIAAARASAFAIGDNSIVDNAGGATGILFTSLENKTQVALDNNTIDLSKFSTFVDQGLVLSAVTANDGATSPVVTFFSTASNTITGATTLFSFPTTGVTGWVTINGTKNYLP